MAHSQKNPELKDDSVIKQIKMISELYDEEIFLNEIISNNKIIKKQNFILFEKEWLNNWKVIVNYEEIKDKCKNAKNIELIKNEIRDLFIKLNTKQKSEELGNMDCSKLKKKNFNNKIYLNESSNFNPIIDYHITSFTNYIRGPITVRGEILNGKIYINDFIYGKDKEKRIILLCRKNGRNEEFMKYLITLETKANVNDMIKEFNNINIDELLNKKEYKEEIFNKNKIINIENEQDIERRIKEEEEKKRKEEEEKKRKEEEEKKRKEEERRKK